MGLLIVDVDTEASVPQRSRYISPLINQCTVADDKDRSEIQMGYDVPHQISLDQALLIDAQVSVALFK